MAKGQTTLDQLHYPHRCEGRQIAFYYKWKSWESALPGASHYCSVFSKWHMPHPGSTRSNTSPSWLMTGGGQWSALNLTCIRDGCNKGGRRWRGGSFLQATHPLILLANEDHAKWVLHPHPLGCGLDRLPSSLGWDKHAPQLEAGGMIIAEGSVIACLSRGRFSADVNTCWFWWHFWKREPTALLMEFNC